MIYIYAQIACVIKLLLGYIQNYIEINGNQDTNSPRFPRQVWRNRYISPKLVTRRPRFITVYDEDEILTQVIIDSQLSTSRILGSYWIKLLFSSWDFKKRTFISFSSHASAIFTTTKLHSVAKRFMKG